MKLQRLLFMLPDTIYFAIYVLSVEYFQNIVGITVNIQKNIAAANFSTKRYLFLVVFIGVISLYIPFL